MKIYAIIATVLSILFGLLPAYIAKTTDHGDELCDQTYTTPQSAHVPCCGIERSSFSSSILPLPLRFHCVGTVLETAHVALAALIDELMRSEPDYPGWP